MLSIYGELKIPLHHLIIRRYWSNKKAYFHRKLDFALINQVILMAIRKFCFLRGIWNSISEPWKCCKPSFISSSFATFSIDRFIS